ncbi:MAG: sporulation protein YqfD [Oscillospiraceae bacterium]|nr:sporulation protein YqfD [Oscillospiraceae bacterium]
MRSYVTFTAIGANAAEFIDELVRSEVRVFGVSADKEVYRVNAAPRSYKAIAELASSYGVRTRVVRRHGAYFVMRKERGKVGVFAGVLGFFAVIAALSGYVWDIRIEGNSQVSDYQIMQELDKSGIRTGMRFGAKAANLAEVELALALSELAWVSIEQSGSRINVKVSEAGGVRDSEAIPLNQPANVISTHTGRLVSAEVYRGELLFEEGSGIRAGDVIVSGVVAIPEISGATGVPQETGNTAAYNYVHAQAELLVEISHAADFFQEYTVMQRAKNGRRTSNTSVVFLGRKVGRELQINPNAEHIDYSERLYTPHILGYPLPLRVLEQDYVFHDRIPVTDTPAAAREALDKQIELYERNFLLTCPQSEITARFVEYFPEANGVGALVHYTYITNTAQKVAISME